MSIEGLLNRPTRDEPSGSQLHFEVAQKVGKTLIPNQRLEATGRKKKKKHKGNEVNGGEGLKIKCTYM